MINFCAELKVHPSLYQNLKNTDVDELVCKTKEFIDSKFMQTVLGDDVVELKGKKHKQGDYLVMNCAGLDIDIQTRNKVHIGSVLQQLLIYCCIKYDVPCNFYSKNALQKTATSLMEKALEKNKKTQAQ